MQKISIVAPVYNEEDSVALLCAEIEKVMEQAGYDYEIVFTDDGSTDGTPRVLKPLSERNGRIRCLTLNRNYGQTAALAAGLDCAKGDIIVTMDADLQNDPADIPALIKKLDEGYDLVNGWRKDRKDPYLFKILPSHLANRLIRKITSVQLHDTGCSLKAFRKEVLIDLHLYGEMHRFIPALVFWQGGKIGELEVNHRPRTHGISNYGISRLPRVILDLLNVKFMIGYSTRPIQLFGKMGLFAFFLAFLSVLCLIGMKIYWRVDMTGNPFLMLSVFLGFVGVQFIVMGMLGEIIIRVYYETTRKKTYSIRKEIN